VARMGEKGNVYRLFVGKPEGKRPIGRPRRTWIANIKMDLLEIELNVVDWTGHMLCSHSVDSQHFMGPEGSLLRSQQLSTCTYPRPHQSSPQHSILSLKGPS
jgi:hypothetical protein